MSVNNETSLVERLAARFGDMLTVKVERNEVTAEVAPRDLIAVATARMRNGRVARPVERVNRAYVATASHPTSSRAAIHTRTTARQRGRSPAADASSQLASASSWSRPTRPLGTLAYLYPHLWAWTLTRLQLARTLVLRPQHQATAPDQSLLQLKSQRQKPQRQPQNSPKSTCLVILEKKLVPPPLYRCPLKASLWLLLPATPLFSTVRTQKHPINLRN